MQAAPGIRVPASSANLGSGFDTLGVALSLELRVAPGEPAAADGHPAVDAFIAAGGEGPLAVESEIPPGRGLGFSGAARLAGALAGSLQQGASVSEARATAFAIAHEREGHADNIAASLHGGVVATADGRAVPVPLGRELAVVAWVPRSSTSTSKSRAVLPAEVPFEDAVFNVGRVALLVAGLAAGDTSVLRTATEDRLHQGHRLADRPESRAVIDMFLDAGAWCAWLSGSGPSVVAFVDPREASRIAAALPDPENVRVLKVDGRGATIDEQYPSPR
jgi:homoserine kinase